MDAHSERDTQESKQSALHQCPFELLQWKQQPETDYAHSKGEAADRTVAIVH